LSVADDPGAELAWGADGVAVGGPGGACNSAVPRAAASK
jgi:hypothetical protein